MGEKAERRPWAGNGVPSNANGNDLIVTREKELRSAIEKASVPVADYRVYSALLNRADWKTATIPVRFQPRSLYELADLSKISVATVKRILNHLQRHGWIERHRYLTDKGIGGRGHPTRYRLEAGRDCNCGPERPEPVSDAERAKRYRERKKAAQGNVTPPDKAAHNGVTDTPGKAAHIVVTHNGKGAQIDVTTGEKQAQIDVTKGLTSRDEDAGQPPFCAEEGRDEGEREEGWPGSSTGSQSGPGPNQPAAAGLCTACGGLLDPVLTKLGLTDHGGAEWETR